ncbi:hypothetical protein [Megasphaera vaginalis (ex Srinivasan et al. 2021)]|uniref:hypothetical protein n=1 Tax=Megasphaera vaginalis (ex Srinivasan et al. 2021) TaxID=1111454 RepID=UPI0012DD8585|nr:hypothetical protein [Megasphaera vaginalis (ex Srinivasan et al. 2021)]
MRYVNSAVHEEKQSLDKWFFVPQINNNGVIDIYIESHKAFGKVYINVNFI